MKDVFTIRNVLDSIKKRDENLYDILGFAIIDGSAEQSLRSKSIISKKATQTTQRHNDHNG